MSKSGDFAPILTFREWAFDSRPDMGDAVSPRVLNSVFQTRSSAAEHSKMKKEYFFFDLSSSRAAEAAASSADKLRAAAHTLVQGTAEQLIAKNSELRAKLKAVDTNLDTAVASQAAIKRKLEKALEFQTSKQAELLDVAHEAILAKRLS